MIGVDANVLVALAADSHPNHPQALAAFERELAANEEIALSLSVGAEFLHAVTDPRRLTPALEMTEAIRWLKEWSTEVAPAWLTPNDEAVERWLKWIVRISAWPKTNPRHSICGFASRARCATSPHEQH